MKPFGLALLVMTLGTFSPVGAQDPQSTQSSPKPSPPPIHAVTETPTPTNPIPPLTSPLEDIFYKNYWYLVLRDTKEVFTAPGRWNTRDWLMFGGVAAGVGTLVLFDNDIKREIRQNRDDTVTDIFDQIQPLGNEYAIGIIGSFYLTGEFFKNTRAKATALDALSATAIGSGLVANSLKYVIGRERPSEQHGAYNFGPFSGNDSFCSGHTTEAFVLASVITEHYDSPWVNFASYGLATMVGYARMNNNRHWASDIAAGAAVGTFVGKTVVRFNREHRRIKLQPIVGPDIRGAQLSMAW